MTKIVRVGCSCVFSHIKYFRKLSPSFANCRNINCGKLFEQRARNNFIALLVPIVHRLAHLLYCIRIYTMSIVLYVRNDNMRCIAGVGLNIAY